MNGISPLTAKLFHTVNRIADNIHKSSFNLFTYRHGDRPARRIYFHTTLQTVGTIHCNSSYRIFTNVLLHFYNQNFAVRPSYLQRIVYAGQHQFGLRTFKVHIDHRPDYLRDMSDNL